MAAGSSTTRHDNNFGFLRLAFATLVVFGHSFDLVGAHSTRPRIGAISSADLAVDGFFLISGYLITMSGERSSCWREYLTKRILRIYPGYVVAYLISVLIIGPMASGIITAMLHPDGLAHLYRILLLRTPYVPGAFHGLPYAILNQPIWTIAYEFRCYLLVIALIAAGVLSRPLIYLALTIGTAVLSCLPINAPLPGKFIDIIGDPALDIHFASMFLCGGAFYVFRDRIQYSAYGAIASILCLLPLSFSPQFAEPALAVFGGYTIFWFALTVKSATIGRVGAKTDLSYGIYLYGWTIQNMIIWHDRNISWRALFVLAMSITPVVAFFSWTLIERQCLRLKDRAAGLIWQPRSAGSSYRILATQCDGSWQEAPESRSPRHLALARRLTRTPSQFASEQVRAPQAWPPGPAARQTAATD